jgi:hypothetical protein
MQDFARFCNAKIDFSRERALTRSQQLRTQVARRGGDKSDAVRLVASILL